MVSLETYIVTFNCGRELIDIDAFGNHLLDGWQDPTNHASQLPQLIVLNLQEIAPIAYSFLGGSLLQPYFDKFVKAVHVAAKSKQANFEYTKLVSHHVGLTAIMLFVREDLVQDVESLNLSDVGCGLSQMANKGAAGARVCWHNTGGDHPIVTTFVSAHLAPAESGMQRRNEDYVHISRNLVFSNENVLRRTTGAEGTALLQKTSARNLPGTAGIYANNTYMFFAGDLNYRTASDRPTEGDAAGFPQPTQDPKDPRHFTHLLKKDQLSQQIQAEKTLQGLTEQKIMFPPSYKYQLSSNQPVIIDKDVQQWKWASHRWPSWCDRILFPAETKSSLTLGSYSILPLFKTSDHRPVALCVSIPVDSVPDVNLAKHVPGVINKDHASDRSAARRKEIVVGVGAYLSLTWEGRILAMGSLLVILGAIFVSKSYP